MSKLKYYLSREKIGQISKERQSKGKPRRKWLICKTYAGDIGNRPVTYWQFVADMTTEQIEELLLQPPPKELPATHENEMVKEICRRLKKLET